MNKNIFKISLITVALSLIACNNVLEEDPKGNLTESSFYQSLEDLELSVPGVALQFNGAFNQTYGAPYAGDDITSKNSGNKMGFHEIDVFKHNSSNDRIPNWWKYFYSTIKVANPIINNHHKVVSTNQTKVNNLVGVAYFYRAASYFFLTRTWGEVPINTDGSLDKNRPNASVQDIYNLILSDLSKAETLLPENWQEAPYKQEGVNILPAQAAAKALLANVYLTMAGWPLKQNDKYALAAAKAKEVIDNKSKYGVDLEDITLLWRKKFTPETVFGCYYNINISGWSWENGSQMGPEAFRPAEEGGWEDGYGEITFYNNFPEGARKNETYQMEYFIKDASGNITVSDYTKTAAKHPFFLKYRYDNYDEVNHKGQNWWGSQTIPVIRYAEVLLTYAEAQAMANSPDASAYEAINAVRARAGLGNLTAGLSKEAFREAVIAERGWEFAGPEPAARWFDLLRTETLAKANSNRDAIEHPISSANMPDDSSHKNYWMPIPIEK